MIRIVIIDDNKNDANQLEQCLITFSKEHHVELEVNSFTDTSILKTYLIDYDYLFIDMELDNGEDGDFLTMELRKYNKSIEIIYVSAFKEYLCRGHRNKICGFLIKPIEYHLFEGEFRNVLNYNMDINYVINDKNICLEAIKVKDIMYVEAISRYTCCYLMSGKMIETKSTLKNWFNWLNETFFVKSHGSFIVNLDYVAKIKSSYVVMNNGKELPLSKGYLKNFKEALRMHILNKSMSSTKNINDFDEDSSNDDDINY